MTTIHAPKRNLRSRSDAAIDGICSGFFAGLLMASYLAIGGWLGERNVAAFFAPVTMASEAFMALVAHLAVAAVYGAIFGLGIWVLNHLHRSNVATVVMGSIYGLILTLFARTLIFAGGMLPFGELPWLHLLLAHLIYGLALGYFFSRGELPSYSEDG